MIKREEIIKIYKFYFLLIFSFIHCKLPISEKISRYDIDHLFHLFLDNSQKSDQLSSWPLNRRFYLLLDIFQKMGALRCDSFRPDERCNEHKEMDIFDIVLHTDRIPVERTPKRKLIPIELPLYMDNEIKRKQYLKNSKKRIRLLKNLYASVKKSDPEIIFFFDYSLQNKNKLIQMIIFLEMAHFFIYNCELKNALWAFVEGEIGKDHFFNQKKTRFYNKTGRDITKIKILDIETLFDKFNTDHHTLKEISLKIYDQIMEAIDDHKPFFCRSN